MSEGQKEPSRTPGWEVGPLACSPSPQTQSVPWHSAPSLYLTFTITHSRMHKTRQKDSDLPPDGMQTCRRHQCWAVLCFRPQQCGCSFRRGVSAGLCVVRLTNILTHKHTLALCPSCVACNLVILGLWPVKGQLWNKITVCSAVRVSPEWCHGGTYMSANLDASHHHSCRYIFTKENMVLGLKIVLHIKFSKQE